MWAAQYLHNAPRHWVTSGSMGTMGFGLPAAIGAQIANPGKLVIDVDGDGSIRMNLGELETLTTYDLPVKVLLLNNLGDGMVRQWQDLFYKSRYSGTDKSAAQEGLRQGGRGRRLRVRQARRPKPRRGPGPREFVEFDGPAFLEVMVDQMARLPDGRPRHGLQGHDHRRFHQRPRGPGSRVTRLVRDVLTGRGADRLADARHAAM